MARAAFSTVLPLGGAALVAALALDNVRAMPGSDLGLLLVLPLGAAVALYGLRKARHAPRRA